MAVALRGPGLNASHGYDPSVYYAAAASLLHGRVPYVYGHFVLLQPPGGMLALAPAAFIGHVTTDRAGFALANLEMSAIGALNAVLVSLVARRAGCRLGPALAGGLLYAVWFAAWNGEQSARLEPLGNACLLLALLVLAKIMAGTAGATAPVRMITAGALSGTAVSVKVWFVVALAVLAGALLRGGGVRAAGWLIAGAGAAVAVIDGPFLLLSRGGMWSMVVKAQLGRQRSPVGLLDRWTQLVGAAGWGVDLVHPALAAAALALVAAVAVLLTVAARMPAARVLVVLAAVHVVTLLVAPSWFPEYADFAAAPLCLCVAAAGTASRERWRAVAWLPAVLAGAVTVAVVAGSSYQATASWGRVTALARRARGLHCVQSDSPSGLIALDVLDRDLSDGCPNWVDVTGRTYLGRDRGPLPRLDDRAWQRDVGAYVRCGNAAYLSLFGFQLTKRTRNAIERDGTLISAGRDPVHVLYRVATPTTGCGHIVAGR